MPALIRQAGGHWFEPSTAHLVKSLRSRGSLLGRAGHQLAARSQQDGNAGAVWCPAPADDEPLGRPTGRLREALDGLLPGAKLSLCSALAVVIGVREARFRRLSVEAAVPAS
jgi:hypothetical protein